MTTRSNLSPGSRRAVRPKILFPLSASRTDADMSGMIATLCGAALGSVLLLAICGLGMVAGFF
jgi:hypothetical protein